MATPRYTPFTVYISDKAHTSIAEPRQQRLMDVTDPKKGTRDQDLFLLVHFQNFNSECWLPAIWSQDMIKQIGSRF